MAKMQSLEPMLQSRDLDRTEAFYRDVLGFERTGREDGWLRVQRDGVALMFMVNDHLGAPTATATQYIRVDDASELWNSIKDKVSAEWGPEDMPYGMHEFAIADPDGYLLSFAHPVEG